MKRTLILLFILHLLTRMAFITMVGVHNNYDLQADSKWLVEFGMQAAHGNFNFELDRFIASPLFPILVGGLKIIFGENWNEVLILFQLLISALSGVFVYKIGVLLFNNRNVGLIASLIYSFFPLTIWFTNTFSQECIFQSLFIFTIYYLVKSTKAKNLKYVIISTVLFSLSYLTKSHILLFAVFIPLIYYHHFGFSKETFLYSFIFGLVALMFSVPYGVFQYKTHGTYVISSNGAGYQFYLGNTEAGYKTIVDVPAKDSEDYRKLKDINNTAGYFNGSESHYNEIVSLPQKEKQTIFFEEGMNWIKNNPAKFIKLKLYDMFFFIIPGVSWRHYPFGKYLFSLLISLPIYLLAFMTFVRLVKERDISIVPIFYIFLSMLLFSVIWYCQNRFRTITIEPFYIIYGSLTLNTLIQKVPVANRAFTSISNYFHKTV